MELKKRDRTVALTPVLAIAKNRRKALTPVLAIAKNRRKALTLNKPKNKYI